MHNIDYLNECVRRTNDVPLTGFYSGSVTNILSTEGATSSTTIWRGGWVTDNFSTYYLDEHGVKHREKPKDSN